MSLAAAFLTACTTVGPDYEAPVSTVPDVWFETAVAGVAEGDASLQTWWTQLDDPTLVSLIERAGASNLDLREAVARINIARANLGIVSGERLPRVDAAGEASRSQLSDNGALDQVAPADGFKAQNLFNLGIDASWEIDVFGRVRRSIESAQASYEASLEDYRDVMVTLFAEVARNYVGVRETQKRIQFAETNASAQRATLRLTRERHDAGATSGLDVVQAESNLRNTEAQIPSLKIQLNIYLNSLAILLGDYPGALDDELEPEAPCRCRRASSPSPSLPICCVRGRTSAAASGRSPPRRRGSALPRRISIHASRCRDSLPYPPATSAISLTATA